MRETDRLEQARDAERGEFAREHRLVPRRRHKALRREIVDLVGLGVTNDGGEGMLVEQVRGDDVNAIQQVADPLVRVVRCAAHDADDLVPLLQQQLGQVGSVLPRDARNHGRLPGLPTLCGRFRFRPLCGIL